MEFIKHKIVDNLYNIFVSDRHVGYITLTKGQWWLDICSNAPSILYTELKEIYEFMEKLTIEQKE